MKQGLADYLLVDVAVASRSGGFAALLEELFPIKGGTTGIELSIGHDYHVDAGEALRLVMNASAVCDQNLLAMVQFHVTFPVLLWALDADTFPGSFRRYVELFVAELSSLAETPGDDGALLEALDRVEAKVQAQLRQPPSEVLEHASGALAAEDARRAEERDREAVAAFTAAIDATGTRSLFAPGAPSEAIAAFRARFGDSLPKAFDLLHAECDGSSRAAAHRLFDGVRLLSLEEALAAKETWDRIAAADDRPEWNPDWIPFAESDHRVHALATKPCFGRPAGAVIAFDFKGGASWDLPFASLRDYLVSNAAHIQASASPSLPTGSGPSGAGELVDMPLSRDPSVFVYGRPRTASCGCP